MCQTILRLFHGDRAHVNGSFPLFVTNCLVIDMKEKKNNIV